MGQAFHILRAALSTGKWACRLARYRFLLWAAFVIGVATMHTPVQAQALFQGTTYQEYRTADGCSFTDDASGGSHDEWWLVSATAAECRNGLVQGVLLFTRANFWKNGSLGTHTQIAFFDKGRHVGWMFSIYRERGFLYAKNYPEGRYLSREDETPLSPAAMKQAVNSLIDKFQRQSKRQDYARAMKPFMSQVMDMWQADSRGFLQKSELGANNRVSRVIHLGDVQNNTLAEDAPKTTGRGARGE